eukprot:TRINITY_DN3678_c0_g1_i1.p1 TRINITY_DN3678_c0_g1~~TRINITY_DN3678_c0_g1_i1.p1  ORF type:complete len:232 (-),score=57.91 TRINITY_DN3678_c0_g1_i1:48-743(-)
MESSYILMNILPSFFQHKIDDLLARFFPAAADVQTDIVTLPTTFAGEWEGQRGLEEEVKITTQPIAKRFMVKLAIFAVMSSALLFLVYPVFQSDWIQMMIGILIALIVYFAIMSVYTVYETYMIVTSQRVVIVMPTTRRALFCFLNPYVPILNKLYGSKVWKISITSSSNIIGWDVRDFADGSGKLRLEIKQGEYKSWNTILDHFPNSHSLRAALQEAATNGVANVDQLNP